MISTFASGTQAATVTTEHFLSSPNAQGSYQLKVDLNAMLANDVVELRVYAMGITGGASRLFGIWTYYGVRPTNEKFALVPEAPLLNDLTDTNALRFSLTQSFGTSRSFPWAVMKDEALGGDETVDGTVTTRQSLRLANSANGGKLAGAATATVTIQDLADTKARITATVDADGNRTAVTRDLT